MLGFVVIHGKISVVESGINHTPHACVERESCGMGLPPV